MSYVGRKPHFLQSRIDELAIQTTNIVTAGSLNNVSVVNTSAVRFTLATAITGFVAPVAPVTNGKRLTITNTNSVSLTIANESTSSIAANRIITGSGGDLTLKAGASISLYYDSTSSRWRVVGGTGSGTGIYKVKLADVVSTTLPTGTVTIDGVGVNADDLVLFANLSSNNNQVYKAVGSGATITSWSAQVVFNSDTSATPINGDTVYIQQGDIYTQNFLFFTGTAWTNLLNNKLTQTLSDNVTNQNLIFLLAADTENVVMEYSISRGTDREVGTFYACHNGTTASVANAGAGVGSTGVNFDAFILGIYFVIRYTATSTGTAPVLKRTMRIW